MYAWRDYKIRKSPLIDFRESAFRDMRNRLHRRVIETAIYEVCLCTAHTHADTHIYLPREYRYIHSVNFADWTSARFCYLCEGSFPLFLFSGTLDGNNTVFSTTYVRLQHSQQNAQPWTLTYKTWYNSGFQILSRVSMFYVLWNTELVQPFG